MIDITPLKVTDTLGVTRGNVNAAYDEIMAHQPFIGTPVNPSINYYRKGSTGTVEHDATLVATNTASTVTNGLLLLCFPENNGVFVAGVWGSLATTAAPQTVGGASESNIDFAVVDIPAVKLATQEASLSTFVTCGHLGLPSTNALETVLPGVVSQPVMDNFSFLTFSYNGVSARGAIIPYIEQGNNVCNIIFQYNPIN